MNSTIDVSLFFISSFPCLPLGFFCHGVSDRQLALRIFLLDVPVGAKHDEQNINVQKYHRPNAKQQQKWRRPARGSVHDGDYRRFYGSGNTIHGSVFGVRHTKKIGKRGTMKGALLLAPFYR